MFEQFFWTFSKVYNCIPRDLLIAKLEAWIKSVLNFYYTNLAGKTKN